MSSLTYMRRVFLASILYALAYDLVFILTTYVYVRFGVADEALKPFATLIYNYGIALLTAAMFSAFIAFLSLAICQNCSLSLREAVRCVSILLLPVAVVTIPAMLVGFAGLISPESNLIYQLAVNIFHTMINALLLVSLVYVELLIPWITPCLLYCRGMKHGCTRHCLRASKPILLWVIAGLISSFLASTFIHTALNALASTATRPLVSLEKLVPAWTSGWKRQLGFLEKTLPRYSSFIADPFSTIVFAAIYIRAIKTSVPPRLWRKDG